jgi:RNA polymerase sigma factor (sigma-70 family)
MTDVIQSDIAMNGPDANDSQLVNACLGGDRDAFSQIVARYQALVASIAYSATGSLGQSEDLAQETFLVAWRQLKSLDQPGKLRAWPCGIARRSTANALRRQQREPSQQAGPLDEIMESAAPEAQPVDHAISREEEAILWRSLEQIPETYREPLILFYREHQSVERVAESLELSNDAVRWGPFAFQTSRILLYGVYFVAGIILGAGSFDQPLLSPYGPLTRRWLLWPLRAIGAFILAVVITALSVSNPARAQSLAFIGY